MKNFNPMHWLDDEYLSAKKAADNVQLIRNYTYFGTVSSSEKYYDLVIPTKTKDGFNWWRINIMPVYNDKRAGDVSKIDLKTIIIDDNIFLPLGGSDWQKRLNHKDAVVNTIPYFEDWSEVFEQLSDILDRMIAKKEGTELEERTKCKMDFETAKKILENIRCKPIRPTINEWAKITKNTPEELRSFGNEVNTKDKNFYLWQWMFNNYDCDYARSYGPNAAYKKLIEEFRERFDDGSECDPVYLVPDSYAEWEDRFGFAIDDPPPSDDWYN